MNSLTYLTSEAFSNIPTHLVVDLQNMLSVDLEAPSSFVTTDIHILDTYLLLYQQHD
jgi:SCY1-like protein 2